MTQEKRRHFFGHYASSCGGSRPARRGPGCILRWISECALIRADIYLNGYELYDGKVQNSTTRKSETPRSHTHTLTPSQPSPNAQPNLNPIYTNAPVYVKSVENGELWTVGEADDLINIVHVWGWLPADWGGHITYMCEQDRLTRWAMPRAS